MGHLGSISVKAMVAGAAALGFSAVSTPASAGWGGGYHAGAVHGGSFHAGVHAGFGAGGWHGAGGGWHGGWGARHGGWHAGYGWRRGWGVAYPGAGVGWAGYGYAAPYDATPAIAYGVGVPAYVVHRRYYRPFIHARCGCR